MVSKLNNQTLIMAGLKILKMKQERSNYLAIIHFAFGIVSTPVGYILSFSPGGKELGLDLKLLENSGYGDFYFAGLLLLIYGILNIINSAMCFFKFLYAPQAAIFISILMVISSVFFLGFFNVLFLAGIVFFVIGVLQMYLGFWLIEDEG